MRQDVNCLEIKSQRVREYAGQPVNFRYTGDRLNRSISRKSTLISEA